VSAERRAATEVRERGAGLILAEVSALGVSKGKEVFEKRRKKEKSGIENE
jgi:hypothetical protein